MTRKPARKTIGGLTQGDLTRQAVVRKALRIAALEGLSAISIGRVAKELRISKSGLFLHFGSKQKLESAVIEEARGQFFHHVVDPVKANVRGIERLWDLFDSWLDSTEHGPMTGGYFFSGAFLETAKQHGPTPRQIRAVVRDWMDALEKALKQARRRDQLKSEIDTQEIAFEIKGLLLGAHWSRLLTGRDQTNARLRLLAKLQTLATDEMPNDAFGSIKAWKTYLKNRNEPADK